MCTCMPTRHHRQWPFGMDETNRCYYSNENCSGMLLFVCLVIELIENICVNLFCCFHVVSTQESGILALYVLAKCMSICNDENRHSQPYILDCSKCPQHRQSHIQIKMMNVSDVAAYFFWLSVRRHMRCNRSRIHTITAQSTHNKAERTDKKKLINERKWNNVTPGPSNLRVCLFSVL